MSNQADPGGGGGAGRAPGYGFDTTKPGYRHRHIGGDGPIDCTLRSPHVKLLGQEFVLDDQALTQVKKGLDASALGDADIAWNNVTEQTQQVSAALQKAYADTFNAWAGDDADAASATFNRTVQSAMNMAYYAGQIRNATWHLHDGVNTLLTITDPDPAGAYQGLISRVAAAQAAIPNTMEWQVSKKTAGGWSKTEGNRTPGVADGPELAGGGVSGTTATPTHVSSTAGAIPSTPSLPQANGRPAGYQPGVDQPSESDPYNPPTASAFDDSTASTDPPVTKAHPPTLDTSSSLAGLSPGSSGSAASTSTGTGLPPDAGFSTGAGSIAGGLGGGVTGGMLGGGVTDGVMGGGVPHAVADGVADGDTLPGRSGRYPAGVDEPEQSTGRPGGTGVLPAAGGSRGTNQDERERSTWLEEDESLWGGDDDAPPAIIR